MAKDNKKFEMKPPPARRTSTVSSVEPLGVSGLVSASFLPRKAGRQIKKMDGRSKDVWGERLRKLQQEFPEVLSENRVDCDQLKKLVGDENVAEGERYQFSWAGKSTAFQEIKKRTTATLKPDRKESVEFDKTKNLFIEGENLEVLRILQKTYYGEVKMIYIDPPYNTGNDFIYNDKFAETREEYEEKTGDVDEEGKKLRAFRKNTKESGHYHSNWLSMMYPRLYLARNLLREDGVIFVSIDDNEVHNLRMIMNEIFGEENFVGCLVIKSNPRGSQSTEHIANVHEYVLLYAKNFNQIKKFGMKLGEGMKKEYKFKHEDGRDYRLLGLRQRGGAWRKKDRPSLYYPFFVNPKTGSLSLTRAFNGDIEVFPIKPTTGEEGSWRWSKKKVAQEIDFLVTQKIKRNGNAEWDIYQMDFLQNEKGSERITNTKTIWDEKGLNYQNGTFEVKELFNGIEVFDFPKPLYLLKKLISLMDMDVGDLILDFFSGSATTAHAVMDLNAEDGGNRKYTMVQLPEEIGKDSEARKAGYKTIADIAKERIRKAGKKVKQDNKDKTDIEKLDIGFKVFKLSDSNFKAWVREEVKTEEELQEKLKGIVENVKEGTKKENMLVELMLKLGINPNAKIEEKQGYYSIEERYIICLVEKIDKKLVEQILDEKPRVVVCLDTAFKGNDELKTNTALQMKSKNIEFKVV